MENKKNFFSQAFDDMKESAKLQHEIDKANFAAVKAESSIELGKAKRLAEQQQRLSDAIKRKEKAEAKIHK